LVGPFDGDAAQQVRVDLVTGSQAAQVRFREHSGADVGGRSIVVGLQSMRPALFLRKSSSTFN
jgi:hypothetical protein